jgi:ABC-type transport system involved in multi-copper enzyme maturation permease subunit
MKGALIIARLTLIETMRRQIQLLTFFLCVGICVLPSAVNVFGLGASDRVVKDIALTLIGFYGIALSVFFGSVALPGEVERKTLYPLVTRPMPRRSYLWGKWLGLMGFIAFSLLVLACALLAAMGLSGLPVDGQAFWAILGYVLEDGVLAAVCLMFSTFSSPPLAAVLGLFVYIVGGLPHAFIAFFLEKTPFQYYVAVALKSLLPHFDFFHVKNAVVHNDAVPVPYMLSTVMYGMVWVVLAQLLGESVFERRDL